MSADASPVLDLLCTVNKARSNAREIALPILGVGLDSLIARTLTNSDGTNVCEQNFHLLRGVSRIMAGHKMKQSLTDWPFENFWGNPHEPRHSKLLGYFIDSQQEHGCGPFLLTKFLKVLEDAVNKPGHVVHRFQSDNCYVRPESEYMDLCIERKCDARRFAIIVENKVNWAVDQDKQLQTYVERVHEHHGFEYHEIYVFYLPLTADKHPARSDREWVESRGAHYKQITFAKEILCWLDSAIRDFGIEQKEGMLENLTHYRNLIRYLNRKQKELEMDAKILDQLKDAETRNALPTLADLDAIMQSLTNLRRCLQQVLRGRLLLAIRDMLQQQGHDVWMCLEKDPLQKAEISSPFDTAFGSSTNVCVRAADTVHVCFGASADHKFWLGYLRDGGSDQQAKISSVILDEAKNQLGEDIHTEDTPWFAWAWRNGVYDENDGENSPVAISKRLVAMRKNLLGRFDSANKKR